MEFFQMLRRQITLFRLPSGLYNKNTFKEDNIRLALFRLRLLLISILLFLSLLLVADFILFRELWGVGFWRKLLLLHILCIMVSSGLLIALKYFSKAPLAVSRYFFRFSVFLLLFMTMGLTLFNLYIADNIYLYIMIILMLGFLFPINPGYFLTIFLVAQAVFLYGLLAINMSFYSRVFHQFNSTIAMIAAITGNILLYRHRIMEFIKNSQIKVGEEYFHHIIGSASQPLLVADCHDGQLLFANKSAQSYFGLEDRELSRQQRMDGLYTDNDEWEQIMALLNEQSVIHGYVAEQHTARGERKWTIAYYAIIEYLGRKAALCEFTDITELKQQELSLIISASSDPLTGIFNRRKGMEMLRKAVQNAQHANSAFVLCFLDIDGLKNVNDTYGHAEGDSIIISLCRIIQNSLTKEDVFYRHGGDEFVILFINKTLSQAKALYRLIRKQFELFSAEGDRPYQISTSGGFCECRAGEHKSCEQLLREADREMYKQKKKRVEEYV